MKTFKKLSFVLAFFASQNLAAQSYSYTNYSSNEGAKPYLNGAVQDFNGYLYAASNGLLRFDGIEFEQFTQEDGLGGDVVSSIFLASDSTMWLGHSSSGVVIKFKSEEFTQVDISSITKNKISAFAEDKAGNIWAAAQKSLILFGEDSLQNFTKPFAEFEVINSLKPADNDHLLVGTDMGIVVLKNASTNPEFTFLDEGPYTNVHDFEKLRENIYLASTEEDGLYIINLKNETPEISQVFDDFTLSSLNIKDLNILQNKMFLACDTSFIELKFDYNQELEILKYTDLNKEKDIKSDYIRFSMFDREGMLWIGTYGDGLFKRNDDFFTFYETENERGFYDIQAKEDYLLASTEGGFYKFRQNQKISEGAWFGTEFGIPETPITAIHEDNSGDIWIGSNTDGLRVLKNGESTTTVLTLHEDNLALNVTDIESSDFYIYAATQGGLFQINRKTLEFNYFDSRQLQHNSISGLVKDAEERIWIALNGKDLPYFENDELKYEKLDEANAASVTGFTIDTNGKKWISTKKGISNITDRVSFDKQRNWLFSDFSYGIASDRNNNILVAHRDGLTILTYDEALSPPYVPKIYSHETGLNQYYSDAIATDKEGNIWLGSDKGILRYRPELNKKNTVEPNLVFTNFSINDSLKKERELHLDYGNYKIRFDFQGITLADGESVKYQYFLQGHDETWKATTFLNFEEYNKLAPGDYVFRVKAYNADGVGGTEEAQISFSIDKPFWQKAWFIILSILLISAVIFCFIRWREKQLKARQEYLERELDARTEEVVAKNHELEEKNKDIMDSINYAKHIQTALIPSDKELYRSMPNSFVFFKPRDVVSGDFYWIKKFEDVYVLVGADCTGHGVPGAFISLIGMSVLKEISVRPQVLDPSSLLNELEIEIENTLNQNKDYGVKDGMDLGVMEINSKTRTLRYAAARRPLLIIRGKEQFLIEGDRQSIGGSYEDEPLKKFTLKEFQLEKGDRLYIWSDGYPDQFGGERGKKLKQKGLIEVLTNIQDKPMDTQHEIIKETFLTWKNGYEQIDDVLLMGIQID